MSEDVYRKLARRLDAIPNGFPATESGVELRLLAKLFTPEEAALATVMRLIAEPPAAIAERAGLDAAITRRMLKDMARKGLIRIEKRDGQLVFGLIPFVVGIYEYSLPRMDEELAALFEEYYQETRGGSIIRYAPSVHRVIPVEEAIPVDLEIFPYERASALLEDAKAWAVRDCICRLQRRLIGRGCEHSLETCLAFSPIEGAFDQDPASRPISKEEALRILRETEEAGLIHSTGNYRDGHFYICNCCTCSCGILRGISEFNIPTAIARSDFRIVVDTVACSGCEACVERCQFHALSILEGVAVADYARCVGCGLCATACSTGALQLERRPEGENPPLAANLIEWMLHRAQERGISLNDIV